MEHSAFDGLTIERSFGFGLAALRDGRLPAPTDRDAGPAATELSWCVGDGELAAMLAEAARANAAACARCSPHTARLDDFGTRRLKAAGVGPDAFFQLALQTAFFALHGRCAATYETVVTLNFLHGRTETGRVCSPEVAAFVRAWAAAGGESAAQRGCRHARMQPCHGLLTR